MPKNFQPIFKFDCPCPSVCDYKFQSKKKKKEFQIKIKFEYAHELSFGKYKLTIWNGLVPFELNHQLVRKKSSENKNDHMECIKGIPNN